MIIVSENKEFVINFENIWALGTGVHKTSDKYVIFARNLDSDDISMGYYPTEQRAKEVLKMFYHFYAAGQKIFEMPEE